MIQIPVGRALLLLIEKYQQDSTKLQQIESFYLRGVQPEQRKELTTLLADPLLSEYTVSFEPHDINNDPTRRYFETHLCFETLKSLLSQINIDEIKAINDFYYKNLIKKFGEKSEAIYSICCVLDVNSPAQLKKTNLEKEISDALCRLAARKTALNKGEGFSTQNPEEFSLANIEKMEMFLHAAFLGIVYANTLYDENLDYKNVDLYNPVNKGNVSRGNTSASSMNYGILKSNMPLSADDPALAQKAFAYPKPSDGSTFTIQSKWPKHSFSLWLQPFSNGISSTIFNQLKAFMSFMTTSPKELDVPAYFTGLISTLMFHSGGHTLYEFTAPFALPEVVAYFKNKLDIDTTSLSLSNLFCKNQPIAFKNALKSACDYNQQLLRRTTIHQEILLFNKSSLKPPKPILDKNPCVQTKCDTSKQKVTLR